MTNPFATPVGPGAEAAPAETVTRVHRYPLPPETREFRPSYDHYRRYVLPSVEGAGVESYTRVTTGAKTLDDTTGLERWKLRSVVRGIKTNPHLLENIDLYADERDVNRDLEAVAEQAHEKNGGVQASEWGTCIHAWAEAVELGTTAWEEVPAEVAPYLEAYFKEMARWGISTPADPTGRAYVERIVYNAETGWVGTFDRIYELADGSRVIGDVKTAKDLNWSYLAISVQLGDYAGASAILSLDGTTWEPMPEIRQDMAVVLHVPSNAKPARASAVTIDLEAGRAAIDAALRVRQMRTAAKNVIPNTIPLPRPGAATTPDGGNLEATQAAIRELLRTCSTREQLGEVYAAYAGAWSDELTAYGNEILSRRVAS